MPICIYTYVQHRRAVRCIESLVSFELHTILCSFVSTFVSRRPFALIPARLFRIFRALFFALCTFRAALAGSAKIVCNQPRFRGHHTHAAPYRRPITGVLFHSPSYACSRYPPISKESLPLLTFNDPLFVNP